VEQREGRIVRNGNTFDEVEIYRVISEPRDVNSPKAHDLQRAQLLERKQTFLTQFRSGNRLGRRLEDVAGDVRLNPQIFALAKAQATGNPLAMEKIKLEHELQQISLLDRSHKLTHHHNRQELDHAEMRRAYLQALLPKMTHTLKLFEQNEQRDAEGKLLSMELKFNGIEFTRLKNANDYLKAHPLLSDKTNLQVNGVDIPVALSEKMACDGDLFRCITVVKYQFAGEWHEAPRGDGSGITTSQSLLTSILARSRDLGRGIMDTERRLEENEQLIAKLQGEIEKKSPYADQLAAYERRLEEVQTELMKNVKESEDLGDVQAEEEGEQPDNEPQVHPHTKRLLAAAKEIGGGKDTVALTEQGDAERLMDSIFQEPRGKLLVRTLSEKMRPGDVRKEPNVKNLLAFTVSCAQADRLTYTIAPFPGKASAVSDLLKNAAQRQPAARRRIQAHPGHEKATDIGR
jgi:hypothetical protein